MGAADVVPGVSGGTIALITGIYPTLISSLRSFDRNAYRLLLKRRWHDLWTHLQLSFLIPFLSGVVLSVLILGRLMHRLLISHAMFVWAFFGGLLCLASAYMLRRMPSFKTRNMSLLVLGTLSCYFLTTMTNVPSVVAQANTSVWILFLCGILSICATLLPGISGSMMMVLLGRYDELMKAIYELDMGALGMFTSGCLLGAVLFSRVIHWLLLHYRLPTLFFLVGCMIGSLNAVWPWQTEGKKMLPQTYAELTGENPHIVGSLLSFLMGISILLMIEYVSSRRVKNSRRNG